MEKNTCEMHTSLAVVDFCLHFPVVPTPPRKKKQDPAKKQTKPQK